MRDSADSDDYGVTRRGKKRGKFNDYESAYAKRGRTCRDSKPTTPTTTPTACRKATAGRPGIRPKI